MAVSIHRIPRLHGLDHSVAFMHEPYEFISQQCRMFGTDVFEMRLLLRRTIAMSGREAAEVFYDPRRFNRAGAAPVRLQESLLGAGGVQSLDGTEHTHRKQMFLSLMSSERIQLLVSMVLAGLRTSAKRWSTMERVVLYDELHGILARSVCEWAGVPLAEDEAAKRTSDLTAMFDRAGAIGPPHWWSRHARNRAERWISDIVKDIRAGTINLPEESAAHRIATARDMQGHLLDPHIAAVEILNVLRPTVAVSVYLVFIVHALQVHRQCQELLGDSTYADAFVQEVRRFYPFFPAVPAIVREDFEWRGYPFPAGTHVLLDLHGVNHDPRVWKDPDKFRPERFLVKQPDAFSFVPQGGGDHLQHHRCAGEWLTVALMRAALQFFTDQLSYSVPEQDLTIDRTRMPALPRSRMVIDNVRLV